MIINDINEIDIEIVINESPRYQQKKKIFYYKNRSMVINIYVRMNKHQIVINELLLIKMALLSINIFIFPEVNAYISIYIYIQR